MCDWFCTWFTKICTWWQNDFSWWRHQMGTFSAQLALCAGNSTVTAEFPPRKASDAELWCFIHLCLNKRLSKQSWGWGFETPLRSVRRHSNVLRYNSLPCTFLLSPILSNCFQVLVIMVTSSNGNIFRVTGHLCGEFTGHRWIPRTKASDAELWCFLWSAYELRLSEQLWGWWFETLSHPLWRRCNDVNRSVI